MRIDVIDEARDEAESYSVLLIKREEDAIVIVTSSLTFFIYPDEEFIESAISLL